MEQPKSRMQRRQSDSQLVRPRMPEFHEPKTEVSRREDRMVGLTVFTIIIGSLVGAVYVAYTLLPI